jgi:hypothetical protein
MITTADLLKTLSRSGSTSSAALDLGGTKILVLDTDEHLSDESFGGRRRTLVVLEAPLEQLATAAAEPAELVAWRARGAVLEELVSQWKKLAKNSPSKVSGAVYQTCAGLLQRVLESEGPAK